MVCPNITTLQEGAALDGIHAAVSAASTQPSVIQQGPYGDLRLVLSPLKDKVSPARQVPLYMSALVIVVTLRHRSYAGTCLSGPTLI